MIVNKKNMEKAIKQLEALKQEVIVNHLEDIDMDDQKALYDEIVSNLVVGNLDDYFLDEVSEDEKEDILSLVHKNIHLCFYDGDSENWMDSVDDSSRDMEMLMIEFLDNYNFLISLAKDGGANCLELLSNFQKSGCFNQSATIDYLRDSFVSDSIFYKIILEMSKDNGLYSAFTDEQKAILCKYPEGTLYRFDAENNEVKLNSPKNLAISIIRSDMMESASNDLEFEDLFPLLKRVKMFEDIVVDMNVDYLSKIKKQPLEFVQAVRGIDKNPSKITFEDVDATLSDSSKDRSFHK